MFEDEHHRGNDHPPASETPTFAGSAPETPHRVDTAREAAPAAETPSSHGPTPPPSPPKEHYNPGAFDLLGDIIQTPRKALSYLASPGAERIGLAAVVYVLSQIPSNWERHPFNITVQSTPLRLIGNAASALIGLAFIVGVIHLFARMLGGRNRYGKLFQAYGIASLPQLLTSPFVVWSLTTGSAGVLQTVVGWGTNIWLLVLQVMAIREVYNFSTARAIAALLLPAFIVGILFGLLAVVLMMLGIDLVPVPDVF